MVSVMRSISCGRGCIPNDTNKTRRAGSRNKPGNKPHKTAVVVCINQLCAVWSSEEFVLPPALCEFPVTVLQPVSKHVRAHHKLPVYWNI